MLSIDPSSLTPLQMQQWLQSAVAPRPIALASTVNAKGEVNLSPFSFFNVFSTNPPILIFSPSRRVRDNTTKHTLENVREVKEVVINIVNFAMVEQTSLSSTEYGDGVNEFVKAGFTQAASEKIQPPRVAEAPVAFECRVKDIIALGEQGGAGNLVIAEVVHLHVREEYLNANGGLDTTKLDLVARMGENWYCRASGEALFEIPKPLTTLGIGVDALPEAVQKSEVLTGNQLGRLGNVEHLPNATQLAEAQEYMGEMGVSPFDRPARHQLAQQLLAASKTELALAVVWE